jgi:hypothetical protein
VGFDWRVDWLLRFEGGKVDGRGWNLPPLRREAPRDCHINTNKEKTGEGKEKYDDGDVISFGY